MSKLPFYGKQIADVCLLQEKMRSFCDLYCFYDKTVGWYNKKESC